MYGMRDCCSFTANMKQKSIRRSKFHRRPIRYEMRVRLKHDGTANTGVN